MSRPLGLAAANEAFRFSLKQDDVWTPFQLCKPGSYTKYRVPCLRTLPVTVVENLEVVANNYRVTWHGTSTVSCSPMFLFCFFSLCCFFIFFFELLMVVAGPGLVLIATMMNQQLLLQRGRKVNPRHGYMASSPFSIFHSPLMTVFNGMTELKRGVLNIQLLQSHKSI